MDKQEWTAEQQVWQRVRANREEPPQNDLRQLRAEAMELAAVYRGLSAGFSGHLRELALTLYRGETANVSALAGIGVLSRQGGENMKLWQPKKEAPMKLLERCYHKTRRCVTEYLARSAEGEFGIVFEKMAKREQEHCCLIAQLLGELK